MSSSGLICGAGSWSTRFGGVFRIASWTALVWILVCAILIWSGVGLLSVRNGLTDSRYFDCKVFFLTRGPELWVTIGWDGWEGQRGGISTHPSSCVRQCSLGLPRVVTPHGGRLLRLRASYLPAPPLAPRRPLCFHLGEANGDYTEHNNTIFLVLKFEMTTTQTPSPSFLTYSFVFLFKIESFSHSTIRVFKQNDYFCNSLFFRYDLYTIWSIFVISCSLTSYFSDS